MRYASLWPRAALALSLMRTPRCYENGAMPESEALINAARGLRIRGDAAEARSCRAIRRRHHDALARMAPIDVCLTLLAFGAAHARFATLCRLMRRENECRCRCRDAAARDDARRARDVAAHAARAANDIIARRHADVYRRCAAEPARYAMMRGAQ